MRVISSVRKGIWPNQPCAPYKPHVNIFYTDIMHIKKVYLVILSVSSAFCVHELCMWISEVTVTEFTVEAGCCSRVIAALLNVFQT